MKRWTEVGGLALLLWACGGEKPPAAEAAAEPPAPTPAPAPPPSVAPSANDASNPCATPDPLTLELEAGVVKTTPWGVEFSYYIEEDKKRPPGYVFLLRSGTRRWETRRNDGNWTMKQTWRGFCWRGGARPERRASRLEIQIAPVCSDGKLVEVGGCGTALGSD